MKLKTLFSIFLFSAFAIAVRAQTIDSWTNNISGKWEANANWSFGVPNVLLGTVLITNAANKTVTIDATTAGIPSVMTISNLVLSSPLNSTNTFSMNNAGLVTPLDILNTFTINGGGVLNITNSALRVDGVLLVGEQTIAATVWINSGQLTATNTGIAVGDNGAGQMAVSNGTVLASALNIGTQVGSQGTLTIAGGTITANGAMAIGNFTGSTGALWLTGGQLTTPTANIGLSGIGRITVSNGTWLAQSLSVGNQAGSQGTLTLAGGTISSSSFNVGFSAGATGTVWVTGGQLLMDTAQAYIGDSGVGRMTVSNGTWAVGDVLVGNQAGSQGTLTVAGGTNTVNDMAYIGLNGSTGTVWVTGGLLGTHDGIDVGNNGGTGQMTVSNGAVQSGPMFVGWLSQGTLTVAGGTVTSSVLSLGLSSSTGTVWVTGGQVVTSLEIGDGNNTGNGGNGQMTVSNGTVLASSINVGTHASSQGTLTQAGGIVTSSSFIVGQSSTSTGAVWLTGGQLTVTNNETDVGFLGAGRMTVSNGTLVVANIFVGNQAGSQGTLTVAGGTVTSSSTSHFLILGASPSAIGTVWVTGGQLTMSNNETDVGYNGAGQMTVSNGSWLAQNVYVGDQSPSQGTLTVAGGTSALSGLLTLGGQFNSATGAVWVTGGQLTVTNTGITVGDSGVGQMTVSNGTVTASALNVGTQASSQGTLTIAGGTTTVSAAMAIGLTAGSTGAVFVTGGQLIANSSTTTVGGGGSGSLTVNGGTMFVRDVNVGPSGTLTLQSGYLNLSGQLAFGAGSGGAPTSAVHFLGGNLVVQPTGLLSLGTDMASVGSFVTNQGIVQILAPNFAFSSGLENQANFVVNNSQIVRVLGSGLGNSGGLIVQPGGVFSANSITHQNGSIFLQNASLLSVGASWVNAGPISIQGGGISGGTIQNTDLIEGYGALTAPLINQAGGDVHASGGLLSLNSASIQNLAGGVMEAESGATLRLGTTLVNQGAVNGLGGIIDLGVNSLTNTGTLTGYGTFKAQTIVNQNNAVFQNGTVSVQANYMNNSGDTTTVAYATATFFGAVTNQSGALFKNTASQITFLSTFFNNGSYISDPATNVFSASLALGSNGALVGGKGDLFTLRGDLTSANADGLQIDGATLEFTSGAHAFTLAGTAHLGTLQLDNSATLTLAGANLYVGAFDAAPSQITSADTIYYDPTQNLSFGGQTFALAGGGLVEAVPEPVTWTLVLLALFVGKICLRSKTRVKEGCSSEGIL